MEQVTEAEINCCKKAMRSELKKKRRNMPRDIKERLDIGIFKRFISDKAYIENDLILAYVSTDIEVDTHRMIKRALEDGKKVAVPLCCLETKSMEYYYITSEADLCDGHYGIKEPDISRCRKADDVNGALCIVPGLCFDSKGYRLGYGGGYYDRFLSSHDVYSVGICYSQFIVDELVRDKYDICVDKVITNPIERNECVEQ